MKISNAKLRTLLILLSLTAVLSVIAGSYLYYSTLKKFSLESAQKEAAQHLYELANAVDSDLTGSFKSVKSLTGIRSLRQYLSGENLSDLPETNAILDHFRDAMQVGVCYLMDRSGKTIASSNRDAADSFVGKNYRFRPYFKKAMQGTPAVYMALGVTSKKRGVYFSHPVYGEKKETPLGVAVIKASIESIEEKMKKPHDGVLLLTDPHGIIFVSSRPDWLYKVLWKASSETIADIAKTRQFGEGPWNWTGVERADEDSASDKLGNEYHVYLQNIANLPDWQLIYLHDHHAVSKNAIEPLKSSVGLGAVVICIFIGLTVFIIFIKANSEIVQRKKAETKLHESEEKFRLIAERIAEVIWQLDLSGQVVYTSPAVQKLFGYTPRETMELGLSAFFGESEKERATRAFARAVSGREPGLLEFRGQKKDGSVIPIEISLTPILQDKTITGVQSITRDITERKRVERALERSEKFLKEAQRIAHLGAWIWDIRDNSEWWSDEQFRIFGFEPGQIKPIVGTFTEAVHPEDKEAVLEAVQKTIEKNAPFDAEFRIVRPDGTIRFVYAQGEVERSKDGKPWRMIGTVLDITRRRKTEQALKESEEKFQSISSSMKDALLTMDDRGEITYWNEAAGKIFGYTKDEVMGKDLHRLLVPEKYRDTFGKGFPKFTATGTGPAIGQILELSALHKDGTEFPIELSLSSIHISEAWQAVGTIRDISDRKGAEQERDKLISDLQNTLKEVKKLSGLLPICSHCKKIRDDNGYWSQIEAYFHKHSEAEFSHSICPECAKKYYPDIDLSEDSE